MSIAAGILCDFDEVVLASDTKYTTGGIVNYGEKVYPLPRRGPLRVVVAGAGPVGFIRTAAQKIEAALPQRPSSLAEVETIVESANKSFYEGYIFPHADPKPNYSLIVALSYGSQEIKLLETTENATASVDGYALIGSGGITAQPYTGLWRDDLPLFEAELMAIFLIKYAKTYDEYCGGDTKVYILRRGGYLFTLDPLYIQEAEEYFTSFGKFALSALLPSETGSLNKEVFDADLQELIDELKRRRVNLNQFHPHAYQLIP